MDRAIDMTFGRKMDDGPWLVSIEQPRESGTVANIRLRENVTWILI